MIKNVILLTIDCLRADHIYHNGYNKKITNTIDNLAKKGINFRNAYSNGPHTHYSFPSILTSSYPLMRSNLDINSIETTLAQILNKNGFTTIGLNSNPFLSNYFGYDKGFKVFNDNLSGDKKNKTNKRIKIRNKISTDGFIYKILQFLDRYWSIKKDDKPFLSAEEITSMSIQYLNKYKGGKLFLWTHFMDAHYPYMPKKETMEELGFEDFSDFKKAKLFYNILNNPDEIELEEIKILENLYDAQIYSIDNEIAKIISFLKKENMWDETLLIVTADHGEEFGEYGDFGHRVDKDRPILKELNLHVPLVVYNSKKGLDKELFYDVSLIDLPPTILDLLEINLPKSFKGKTLLPMIEGMEEDNRNFFSEHEYQKEEIVGKLKKERKKAIAFRRYPYKLIYYEDKNYWLYNLKEDPNEKNNILNESNTQKIFYEMKNKIESHLNEIERSKIAKSIGNLKGI